MKKIVATMILSASTISAHAQVFDTQAQYCLGVYMAKDELINGLADAAKSELDAQVRRKLELQVKNHRQIKERLSDYLNSFVLPAVPSLVEVNVDLDTTPGLWRRHLMVQATHDALDVTSDPAAAARVALCDDLAWLK